MIICVLAIGDDELTVGDDELTVGNDNDVLSGVAMGRHVHEVLKNSHRGTSGIIWQSSSRLLVFGGLQVLINFVITIFKGIFIFYSLLQIE